MTHEEALGVARIIFSGFPRVRRDETILGIWAGSLMRHEHGAATRAAQRIIAECDSLPALSEVHARIDAQERGERGMTCALTPPREDCPDCHGMGFVDGGWEVHAERRYSVVEPCGCRRPGAPTRQEPPLPRRAELPGPVVDAIEAMEHAQAAPVPEGVYRMICGYVTTLGPDRAARAVRYAAGAVPKDAAGARGEA